MAKFMVVIGFLVAFAAGLTVGLEARRTSVAEAVNPPALPPLPATTQSATAPTTRQGRSPGGWIASQLKLRPDQQEQMDKIWSEVARGGREEVERRRDQLRKERDEKILALIGPDDKPKYDAILKKYHEDQKAVERDMRQRFEDAVKETDKILTDEQREKYHQLLNRHRPPDRDEDRRRDGDRDRERRGDRGRDDDDDDNNKKAHAKRGGDDRNRERAKQQSQAKRDDDGKRKSGSCEQARGTRDARDAGTCAKL